MKHITKKEAHRRAQHLHRLALVEGRAVRWIDDCATDPRRAVTTFPTRAGAEQYLADCLANGIKAELLRVSLEDQAKSLGLPGVPESWLG